MTGFQASANRPAIAPRADLQANTGIGIASDSCHKRFVPGHARRLKPALVAEDRSNRAFDHLSLTIIALGTPMSTRSRVASKALTAY